MPSVFPAVSPRMSREVDAGGLVCWGAQMKTAPAAVTGASPPRLIGVPMAVSKRTRFEVLRRDNHTCRYCGQSAPDVKLTVDHVLPVALGGGDDPTNLVAACKDCNSGKSSMSPDAPLVAEVKHAALVWSAAMSMAAERAAARREKLDELFYYFEYEWNYSKLPMLPRDWRAAVGSFDSAGLSFDDFTEAMEIVESKRGVIPYYGIWPYFYGICRNKLRELEADARAIIAAQGVEI